jgi:enoyl-CoA hydratase/carnithine racemase
MTERAEAASKPGDLVRRTELQPGVVQLTLCRPEKLNALTEPLVSQLHSRLRDVAADPRCRVLVLTGAGRGFCAGLDLGGFGPIPGTEEFGRTRPGQRSGRSPPWCRRSGGSRSR